MSEKEKTILVDENSTCFPSGAMPHYDIKHEEVSAQPERILVLGAGCPKCRALEQTVIKSLDEMNETLAVGHVTDYAEMAKYGVMSTPAPFRISKNRAVTERRCSAGFFSAVSSSL